MTILPIPLRNSRSVVEYFKQGGKVEVPRPQECFFDQCRLKEPLRKNGSYARQVIYWGLFFLVQICRFRCKRCGRTASCPFGWLVPYRRFSAEVMSAGVEAYTAVKVSYRDLSADLSDLELADPGLDIRGDEFYAEVIDKYAAEQPVAHEHPPCRPAHTTVFNWADFICKRVEILLAQVQKELVQDKKRGKEMVLVPAECVVENPNSYKAATGKKRSRLDKSTFATLAARLWLGDSRLIWYRLRAYFLTKAESRKDVLTDTRVWLPITQTSELVIF